MRVLNFIVLKLVFEIVPFSGLLVKLEEVNGLHSERRLEFLKLSFLLIMEK